MAYTPPTGNSIVLAFDAAYTPPAGNSIVLEFEGTVAGGVQYCFPAGWDSAFGQYGTPTITVAYIGEIVAPHGWDSMVFGVPTIRRDAFLRVRPTPEFTLYGVPHDADYEDRVRRFKGFVTSLYGRPTLFTNQHVRFELSESLTQYGRPEVDPGFRYVKFLGKGFETAEYGEPNTEGTRLKPLGFDTFESEVFAVHNADQVLVTHGVAPPELVYPHYVVMWWQYLYPEFIPTQPELHDDTTAEYGKPKISGPGGPLQPSTFSPGKVGYPAIYNEADAVAFESKGLDSSEFGEDTWVSNSVRTLTTVGVDTFYGPLFLSVRNAAQAVTVGGIAPPDMHRHDVRDQAQYVTFKFTTWENDYGQPWASFGVRTLAVFFPPGPLDMTRHRVSLWQNYIAPVGLAPPEIYPWPRVDERFTIITTKLFEAPPVIPRPTIVNVNRAITSKGQTYSEYGLTRLHKTTLEAVGVAPLEIPRPKVRDQTTYVHFNTMGDVSAYAMPNVRHDPPIAYPQDLYAVGLDAYQPGDRPTVGDKSIYVHAFTSSVFGDLTRIRLVDRILRPKGWFGDEDYTDLFGVPYCSYDKSLHVSSIPLDLEGQVPKFRVDPHYILAPNPNVPVDMNVVKEGKPTVAHFHRTLAPVGFDSLRSPRHKVYVYSQYVTMKPTSQLRFGNFKVLGGHRTYAFGYIGTTDEIPDTHKVSFEPPPYSPYLYPPGKRTDVFGDLTRIELFNRELLAETDDDDHQRHGLHNIFFDPRYRAVPSLGVTTLFGPATFVSYQNRTITPVGFDSFNLKSTYPGNGNISRYPKGITPVHALR